MNPCLFEHDCIKLFCKIRARITTSPDSILPNRLARHIIKSVASPLPKHSQHDSFHTNLVQTLHAILRSQLRRIGDLSLRLP